MSEFYGLSVGDRVCAHGKGFGVIEELHQSDYPSSDYVTVRLDTRKCRCDCGHVHEIREVAHAHPRHVSKQARK